MMSPKPAAEGPRTTDPNEILRLPMPLRESETQILLASVRDAWSGQDASPGAESGAVDLGNGLVRGADGLIYRAEQ
jgi:hypothetical protein